MRRLLLILTFLSCLSNLHAAGGSVNLIDKSWSFEGITGKFDKQSIQRGYQVYKEVCSGCHSMKRIYYRNLIDIGFSAAEAKMIASEQTITDGPDENGDMYERKAVLADHFVAPFPNEQAARAANGGAYPPDLSLIIKARPNGADYVYSLLNGYIDVPEGADIGEGMYYNIYYPGKQIAMAQPLYEGQVEYMDGTDNSLSQMSYDLVNFLQWAAEPEMEHRKQMGMKVLIFLILFTIFFFIAKKRIWRDVR